MTDEIKIEIVKRHLISPAISSLPFVRSGAFQLRQVDEFQAGQPLIFVTQVALEVMQQHTGRNTRGEVGGLLMGDFFVHGDIPFTWVEVAIVAKKAVGSAGGLTFTPEAIEEVSLERETQHPQLRSVGWYHSHPGFGIFLSGTDLNTQQTVFNEGPYVATVLDPIRKTNGVFGWIGKKIVGPLAYWIVSANRVDKEVNDQ